MVSIGVVVLDEDLDKTFYTQIRPITDEYVPEALAVSGFSREQTQSFIDAETAIKKLDEWINFLHPSDRVQAWSDNPGFDLPWVTYYGQKFLKKNIFGHSCRDIGTFYLGLNKSMRGGNKWKSLRETKHPHHALEDAIGNAEAMLRLIEKYNIKV